MGPCHCHLLSSLVDSVPSAVPKLSAAASFHSSSEGHMDSKALADADLHLQFLAPHSGLLQLPKSLLCSLGAKGQKEGGCPTPAGWVDICQSIARLVAQGPCIHL